MRVTLRPLFLLALSLFSVEATAAVPREAWGWETVPNVIRTDGVESFLLEITPNRPVDSITLDINEQYFSVPSGETGMTTLRDDGLGGDRIAGDFIYTSEPLRYRQAPGQLFPSNFLSDPNAPAGLHLASPGHLRVRETNGNFSFFSDDPEVGLLRTSIPTRSSHMLAPDVQVSQHLINVQTSRHLTQSGMRYYSSPMQEITRRIYDVVPDAFDFLMFFSTNKVERFGSSLGVGVAGMHNTVQVNYQGTGLALQDNSALYGSDGRLLSINRLDMLGRGITTNNAIHELMHQWSFRLSNSFGLGESPHSSGYSNIDSFLGGFAWIDNGNGTYRLDPKGGPSNGASISDIEAYLMGLIDGSDVGPLMTYDPALGFPIFMAQQGTPITPDDIVANVSIEEIQQVHGVRSPGPATAQRDFAIGFVAETNKRLLTPTEITFYDILAEHFTTGEVVDYDRYADMDGWASLAPYFGHGTTWTSDIPLPGLPGDFNSDGIVDAADYTVWRDNANGDYDAADYVVWRNNYGRSAISGATVPEPATALILAVVLLAGATRGSRSASRLA